MATDRQAMSVVALTAVSAAIVLALTYQMSQSMLLCDCFKSCTVGAGHGNTKQIWHAAAQPQ